MQYVYKTHQPILFLGRKSRPIWVSVGAHDSRLQVKPFCGFDDEQTKRLYLGVIILVPMRDEEDLRDQAVTFGIDGQPNPLAAARAVRILERVTAFDQRTMSIAWALATGAAGDDDQTRAVIRAIGQGGLNRILSSVPEGTEQAVADICENGGLVDRAPLLELGRAGRIRLVHCLPPLGL